MILRHLLVSLQVPTTYIVVWYYLINLLGYKYAILITIHFNISHTTIAKFSGRKFLQQGDDVTPRNFGSPPVNELTHTRTLVTKHKNKTKKIITSSSACRGGEDDILRGTRAKRKNQTKKTYTAARGEEDAVDRVPRSKATEQSPCLTAASGKIGMVGRVPRSAQVTCKSGQNLHVIILHEF